MLERKERILKIVKKVQGRYKNLKDRTAARNQEVYKILRTYQGCFEDKFRVAPPQYFTASERGLVKSMIKKWGVEEVEVIIKHFFNEWEEVRRICGIKEAVPSLWCILRYGDNVRVSRIAKKEDEWKSLD